MAGIYIHIPFCSTKCHYCNFLSTVSLKHKENVLAAVLKEIAMRKNYLEGEKIETIYYGGGTPTLLSKTELSDIQNSIKDNFEISENCEITIEANPDDLHSQKLEDLLAIGFNRLSIGTQAFDDDLLKQLNRRHTANQSFEAVTLAKEVGFRNISIDLIYGIPGLNNEKWVEEIHRALQLDIEHISAYHLTVEPGTALEILIKKKKYPAVDEEIGMQQFEILMDELNRGGFEHYEISNFAKPNKYSKHNTSYWNRKKYLGIGPSAHSFNLNSRSWNTNNLQEYFNSINKDKLSLETENLAIKDHFNEYIMLSLRTSIGVSESYIKNSFPNYYESFLAQTQINISKNLMKKNDGFYILTRKGRLLADGIASDFFQ